MANTSLLRYNFRVLMFHNGWLLSIPIAVSQLTIFWTAATQRFIPPLPATMVETVSPLLAAFLCAHLLSAEYRSGVGAVLASKPVDIRKVVLVRLALAMALVWALAGLGLLTFYQALEPYPMLEPLLAGCVSTLFLGMLALTFATLLRHPLAGFGIAALYWALDLPPGPPMNPYLSLKSLAASFRPSGLAGPQPLTDSWWIAKIVLVVAALALFALHNRLLFQLGTPMTPRRGRGAIGAAVALIGFYLLSGAVLKVGYGYAHRGELTPNDLAWFRRQFGAYGMLPVSAVFGRNYQRYLGAIPNAWRILQDGDPDINGDTEAHHRDLRLILEVAPNSIWAPSAAEQLARFEAKDPLPVDEKVALWRPLVDRYPDSPYTLYAAQQIARLWADAAREDEARAAYVDLLKRFPKSVYSPAAYRFLAESDRRRKDLASAEANARRWIETAPVHEGFLAWLLLSEIQKDQGKADDAAASRAKVVEAIAAFRAAARARRLTISEPRRVRVEQEATALEKRFAAEK